jgi:hypothetical protein
MGSTRLGSEVGKLQDGSGTEPDVTALWEEDEDDMIAGVKSLVGLAVPLSISLFPIHG